MTVYVILFMVPLAFYIKKSNYEYSIKLLVFLVVACLIIGLRRDTVDRDYIGYVYSYITPVKAITEYIKGSRFTNEPGIGIISSIIIKGLKLGYQWVFILFAFLGLSLKVEAFRHIAPECFFAALLIHFSNTLFLHDFTQIRVSIALGLFLFSIQDIFEKRLLLFTLKILIACMFHYSAVILVPLYFIYCLVQVNKKILSMLLLSMIAVLATAGIWLPRLFVLVPRLSYYFNSASINFLNPLVFMRFGIIAIALIGSDIKHDFDDKSWFYLTIYALGTGTFYFFHSSAGIGLRLSQVFFAIDPVAIPYLLKRFRMGTRKGIVIAISMAMFLANLYLIRIVNPYSMSLEHLISN